MFSALDHQYMSRALQLAAQGLYSTSPNPRVGCVIVNSDTIVGEGAHIKAGEGHAEVIALKQAGAQAKGATAYVTLEPCSHHGRTPPCAEALIKAGVVKVIAAMQDPNPLVAGQGLALLASQGVNTDSGLMQQQAEALNVGFVKRMNEKLPFVRCKIAASLDGKTALANGESQWITAEPARQDVQHWRAQSCAILTGIGTVLADDPSLNVRTVETSRQPLRVIVDSTLKTPLNAKVLQDNNVLIAYAEDANKQEQAFVNKGVALFHAPGKHGQVCLRTLMQQLARLQVNEVLVEAGETLSGALLHAKLVDELLFYYAPKLMGNTSRNMLTLPNFTAMSQVIDLKLLDVRQVGHDIRVQAAPKYHAD